ncbi:SGNH/GDSL hydrolase family protein [Streptomyces sp. NPDC052687]|uniref:SGNH/GDSL hydrolase family protein n=1 Tax=Streptomyces sp. NPDC052687 TaxID=3154759 RepID=UPI0034372CD4
MRGRWAAGWALAGALLLGGCGDPASGAAGPPAAPSSPKASATTHRKAPAAPARPPAVLYLGDSLAMENQRVLGQELRRDLKARYTSAPYSGTTLCDYLEGTGERSLVPGADKAAALVRSVRPDVVVLQFWGNAWGYTPCMDGITYDAAPDRYLQRYAADARRLAEQITDAGGQSPPRIVWVLQGPDPITPERVRKVNAVYAERAAASGGLVADAGRAVSPASGRHTWVRFLPCTAWERAHPDYCTEPGSGRTALHRDDDYLHFCLAPTTSDPKPCPVRSPGVVRIAREIARAVARVAGSAAEDGG